MIDQKEKLHMTLNKRALEKAVKALLGGIGDCRIFYDEILCNITSKELEKNFDGIETYRLKLPSMKDINEKAKSFYKYFNMERDININYSFYHLRSNRRFIIDTEENLTFTFFSDFEMIVGIVVNNANKVDICLPKCGEVSTYDGLFINSNELNITNGTIYGQSADAEFHTKTTRLTAMSLYSFTNIEIDSKLVELDDSGAYCSNLTINADKIIQIPKTKLLVAKNKISINDKSNDLIKDVEAKQYFYNGIDITNSEMIALPELRQKLISKLSSLIMDCNSSIKEQANEYKESLKQKSICKVLRK